MLSVRDGICNGRGALYAYRKYERTHPVGTAYETPRGMWICSITNLPTEAFATKKEAVSWLVKGGK